MDKRKFIKQLAKGTVGLASSSWLIEACMPASKQVSESPVDADLKNWSWATPNHEWKLDDWKKRLTQAKESGIDAILLEVYNGDHAYFDTDRLDVEEDLLGQVLPICQDLGLEFHAWMWTMPCNNKKIVSEHPDWYAVNGLGQSAATHPAYVDYYKFLDPCNPEAQNFIRENVHSLAQIKEIDGVHLDYVRLPDVILAEALQPKYNIVQDREYPEYDYSYSEICRQSFKEQTGIDPLTDLEDPSAHSEWRQFRYDSVSNLVNGILLPEAKKFDKKVTAAVFPNWKNVRQEWHTWDLDAFLPMLYHNFYNKDIDFVRHHVEAALGRMEKKKPVYGGVFVPSLSPEELAKTYELSIQGGGKGISTFALGSMTDDHFAALKKVVKASKS
ncbi:family 10 glycosylhydrolase [Reichenbachiella ulvae]|uniref:Family 10 glycosylhydrolase n=1 Tax=Reichenbachiella ulvae TaxID=2980104 RepID=A0ABT3CNW0_9BACT|nr:family 10 glycosylhydrolase [Reichenbachiella ulvae]MCV9385332.1 family 10 glycosylhydrolase [Reichenbachiella ulvae]